MIKVVLWDIDGTILDFDKAEYNAIKALFIKHQLGDCTDDMIKNYSNINKKYWEALERKEMTKPEILVGRFREFFSCYGIDESKAEAFNADYQIALGDTIAFYPNAIETINALKGRVLQFAVTNGTKIAQTKKLNNSGLINLLDGVFISEDLGVEKPSKEFFEKVFDCIGHRDKSEVIIVGDSLTSDILGGNNAEILTCHFNPFDKPVNHPVHIDYSIKDLSEILTIVK